MLFVPRILDRACDKREHCSPVRRPEHRAAFLKMEFDKGETIRSGRLFPFLSHPPSTLIFTKRRRTARR